MKKIVLISGLVSFVFASCFKEIDTVPLELTIEKTFTVQNSIQTTQTYYYLYENVGLEVITASPRSWDLAFESAGEGSRVMLGWATSSIAHKTGKYNIADVSQTEILDYINNSGDWMFDDPAYTNYLDSLSLQNWEDGEVYVQNRGVESDNYYLIQFVEKTDDSYTFNYAKATDNQNVQTYTINRSDGLSYIHFSFDDNETVTVEPRNVDWDLLFTPYLGWWETLTPGEYSPYTQSGILINYETGVEVAQIFDPSIDFEDIDESYIATSEFTDWKGVIGSNWKVLGGTDSENLYNMDPDKKYLLKKYDPVSGFYKYFKLRIIDYKLDGEDHHPTVEFKFLAKE
ncbi:MAG: hypothetical protein DRI95_09430 [Bacteroidetes bacterium]|nr:MAG: hypothetical protein DRI95_09430 [Bacteroidota bacterium]